MRTPLAAALFAACLLTPCPAEADPTPTELQARVPELIKQLGADKYATRRAAQQDLAAVGLTAFDALLAARDDRDLEIASSAERLLAEMTVRWTQPSNPPAVRDLLDTYGQRDAEERLEVIAALAALPDLQGLQPLCCIARFDLSDRVAARAAAVAMQVAASQPSAESGQGYEVSPVAAGLLAGSLAELEQYYGPSQRGSAQWLAWFAAQGDDPQAAAAKWRRELDRLRAQQQEHPLALEGPVVDALDWNLLRVLLRSGEQQGVAAVVTRLAESDKPSAPAVMRRAFEWLTLAGADAAIDELLTFDEPPDYLQTQDVLYLAAGLRRDQGREEQARALAERAFEAGPEEADPLARRRALLQGRVVTGLRLRSDGQPDWAERELRAAIEEAGPLTAEGAYASWSLADLLHDAARSGEAATALSEFVTEVESSPENASRYLQLSESRTEFIRPLAEIKASEAYFRALARRDAGDAEGHRAALVEAFELDGTNADIPIAMYRASAPGEEYRANTMRHIEAMAEEFEAQIDQDPSDSTPYNQWAWLVSNTEGDYDKAVRYSLRSLQLSQDNPGYLDTLGRCYYAAGDLDKAIEAQSRAVGLEPQYQVMQRQLQFFKDELAKRQTR